MNARLNSAAKAVSQCNDQAEQVCFCSHAWTLSSSPPLIFSCCEGFLIKPSWIKAKLGPSSVCTTRTMAAPPLQCKQSRHKQSENRPVFTAPGCLDCSVVEKSPKESEVRRLGVLPARLSARVRYTHHTNLAASAFAVFTLCARELTL